MDETVGLTEEDKKLIHQKVGALGMKPHHKEKSSLKFKFFACVIIALVFVNGSFLYIKSQEKAEVKPDTSVLVIPKIEPEPEVVIPEVIEVPKPAPPVVDTISPKLDSLTQKVQELDLRTWMLGIAINENAHISRELAPVGSGIAQKYIQFDSQWKLNKMPEYLDLPEANRKRLAELVRENPEDDPNP